MSDFTFSRSPHTPTSWFDANCDVALRLVVTLDVTEHDAFLILSAWWERNEHDSIAAGDRLSLVVIVDLTGVVRHGDVECGAAEIGDELNEKGKTVYEDCSLVPVEVLAYTCR